MTKPLIITTLILVITTLMYVITTLRNSYNNPNTDLNNTSLAVFDKNMAFLFCDDRTTIIGLCKSINKK